MFSGVVLNQSLALAALSRCESRALILTMAASLLLAVALEAKSAGGGHESAFSVHLGSGLQGEVDLCGGGGVGSDGLTDAASDGFESNADEVDADAQEQIANPAAEPPSDAPTLPMPGREADEDGGDGPPRFEGSMSPWPFSLYWGVKSDDMSGSHFVSDSESKSPVPDMCVIPSTATPFSPMGLDNPHHPINATDVFTGSFFVSMDIENEEHPINRCAINTINPHQAACGPGPGGDAMVEDHFGDGVLGGCASASCEMVVDDPPPPQTGITGIDQFSPTLPDLPQIPPPMPPPAPSCPPAPLPPSGQHSLTQGRHRRWWSQTLRPRCILKHDKFECHPQVCSACFRCRWHAADACSTCGSGSGLVAPLPSYLIGMLDYLQWIEGDMAILDEDIGLSQGGKEMNGDINAQEEDLFGSSPSYYPDSDYVDQEHDDDDMGPSGWESDWSWDERETNPMPAGWQPENEPSPDDQPASKRSRGE